LNDPLPFISLLDATGVSSGTIVATVDFDPSSSDVSAVLTGNNWLPRTIVQLKFVVHSTYSQQIEQTLEDSFTLTLDATCAGNTISVDPIYDVVYTIGENAETRTPSISTAVSVASCPLNAVLYGFQDGLNVWLPVNILPEWIDSFDSNTGEISIRQDAGAY